jgi:nicotinamidase-related amidase
MQPYYTSSQNKATIKAVVKEIVGARKAKQKVVVVQYEGEGRGRDVDKRILHRLRKYPRVERVVKQTIDGGAQVVSVLSAEEKMGEIDFCGVEQSMCVKETAQTTKRLCPTANVNVLTHACNDHELRTQASQDNKMQELVNFGVQVI